MKKGIKRIWKGINEFLEENKIYYMNSMIDNHIIINNARKNRLLMEFLINNGGWWYDAQDDKCIHIPFDYESFIDVEEIP